MNTFFKVVTTCQLKHAHNELKFITALFKSGTL